MTQVGNVIFRDDGVVELSDTTVAPSGMAEGEDGPIEPMLAPQARPATPPAYAPTKIGPARDLPAIVLELERRLEVVEREIQNRKGLEAERRNIKRLIKAATTQPRSK